MGIKDLFTVIKVKSPEDIHDYHLSQWRGHSFAIDISIFLNKYVKSAGEKLWMNTFFLFFCSLKKHGIKAVCVFDGPNPPIEKKAEQESRKEGSEKAKKRMRRAAEIRDLLTSIYIPKSMEVPENLQEECKILIGTRQKSPRTIVWSEPTDLYDALKELVSRLEKQTSPITNEQREKAWEITKMMGLPTFQADGEAEALCAYLAIHGYVDAVLSEDSDVLAYGTPWMVAYKDYKLGDEKIKAVHLPSLLENLGYTMEEFRDLCILLSCDYNSRVKGFPPDGKKHKNPVCIGWIGAVAMIDEYRRLEVVEEHVEDISPLIYQRCRELFTPVSSSEMDELIKTKPYNMKPNILAIKEFFKREYLNDISDYIEKCWEPSKINYLDSSSDKETSSENDLDELDESSSEELSSNEGYYVILGASCATQEGGEDYVKFAVKFKNEDVFTEENDYGFDYQLEIFNKWIQEKVKGGEDLYIDDCVECESIIGKMKPQGLEFLDLTQ